MTNPTSSHALTVELLVGYRLPAGWHTRGALMPARGPTDVVTRQFGESVSDPWARDRARSASNRPARPASPPNVNGIAAEPCVNGSTGYPRRRQPCRPPANGRTPRTPARRRWRAAPPYKAARAVLAGLG